MSQIMVKNQMAPALVVKLGGSLYEHVPGLVAIFRQSNRTLFIVPGGGRFADKVREARLSDDEAHWEAIKAMDHYGRYISSFGLESTDLLTIPEKTSVFLPYRMARHYDPLPHTWDVTSDTIAAWVAHRLGLDLLVLKSVDGISIGGTISRIITRPVTTDVVDPCFIPYVLQHRIRTIIINGSVPEVAQGYLQGKHVPGTRIGTTF
jgi:aspartokinase-like uncharacterized kinase